MRRLTITTSLLALLLSGSAFASTCYVSMSVDRAWAGYNVAVNAVDYKTGLQSGVGTFRYTGGKAQQAQFQCVPGDEYTFYATVANSPDSNAIGDSGGWYTWPFNVSVKGPGPQLTFPMSFKDAPDTPNNK
jgi:hypothetical protein